ncbi:hypothetical protein HanPSC8_Chr00c324g0807731 [Helianthus annuus]|nr:hypothetical protein HanPSC8_Chr00c324g0807731 [Helianthus annuus]
MVRRGSMSPFVIISGCLRRPQGKGNLGALGDPDGTGVPKQHLEKHGDKKFRRAKKPHEPVVIPPLVSEVVGISRIRLRKYNDYVVVSDTLEGLGVPGGDAAVGGSSAGSKPANDKKRKCDASAADGQKGPKLRRTWIAAISQPKTAVVTEPREESFSLFDVPSSPPRDATVDAGVNKEFRRSPSIEVVTPPSARAEDTGKKVAGQTIVDTVHSSDNLIDPRDADVEGVRNRSPLMPKSQTPLLPRRNHLVRLPRVQGLKINRPFSLVRLNWNFITPLMRKVGV